MIEPGDLVVNQHGYVMLVERDLGDEVICVYECNPSCQHKYKKDRVRLLKKGGTIQMSAFNSIEFANRIERQREWGKNVKGLPRKYKEKKEKGLDDYSIEELEGLLKALEEIKGKVG